MKKTISKKVTAFIMIFLVCCAQPNKAESFSAKQPIQYNWAWDINDLDQKVSIPFERYSYHRYIKAETDQTSFYLARGSETPIEFDSFHRYEGSINWRIQLKKRWVADQAFLINQSSVLLNLEGETRIYDLKSGTFLEQITLATQTVYGIFFDDEWILYEEPGKALHGWNRNKKSNVWDFSLQAYDTYRLLGKWKDRYLVAVIRSNSLYLVGIPLDNGKEVILQKWKAYL